MNPSQNDDPKDQSDQNQSADPQPKVVYMARPIEPHRQELSPEAQKLHTEAKEKYPYLNLSDGEYVIFAIKRHPIGLVYIWSAVIISILAVMALYTFLVMNKDLNSLSSSSSMPALSPGMLLIPALLVGLLIFVFGFVAAYIYSANRFYLTNESVIQHIQMGLFNKREQTISLSNVEDASYTQDGILPHIFGYGLLRLSTQGDETTYRFSYASQPAKQIAVLNNAVESFKNVRPIGE